jgi:hypothetical protein
MSRYSAQYVAQLIAQQDYGALVDLQGIALGWDRFDANDPSFGWPQPIFVVFEILTWLAQGDRSGVWTYYEATPLTRHDRVVVALEALQAAELRRQYVYGKEHWRIAEAIGQLDNWLSENEQSTIRWAFSVLLAHPDELALVCF